MKCAWVGEMIDLYVQGRLVRFQARWLEAHLAACPRCAAEASAWKRMFRGLRSLPAAPAPPGLKAALRAAWAEASSTEPPPASDYADAERPAAAPSMALASGAAAFAVSVSISIFGPGVPTQTCSDADASVCFVPLPSPNSLRRALP